MRHDTSRFYLMQIVGSILLPDHSLAGVCLQPSLKDSTCLIVKVAGQSSLLLLCQYSVPDEKAAAWAETLFHHVKPEQTLILASQVCIGQLREV